MEVKPVEESRLCQIDKVGRRARHLVEEDLRFEHLLVVKVAVGFGIV